MWLHNHIREYIDLRSGAFKILQGGQLPMAYQVMLHGSAVAWRYPHPRAITRVVAFPLPGAVCTHLLFTRFSPTVIDPHIPLG